MTVGVAVTETTNVADVLMGFGSTLCEITLDGSDAQPLLLQVLLEVWLVSATVEGKKLNAGVLVGCDQGLMELVNCNL